MGEGLSAMLGNLFGGGGSGGGGQASALSFMNEAQTQPQPASQTGFMGQVDTGSPMSSGQSFDMQGFLNMMGGLGDGGQEAPMPSYNPQQVAPTMPRSATPINQAPTDYQMGMAFLEGLNRTPFSMSNNPFAGGV